MSRRQVLWLFLGTLLIAGLVGFAGPQPLQQDDVTVDDTLITIQGTVTNGTEGGTVPENMVVHLLMIRQDMTESVLEARVDADGRFAFTDVPRGENHAFIVSTQYQSGAFNSEFMPASTDFSAFDVPLTIYEMTSDPSVIEIASVRSQIFGSQAELQILQIVSLTNTSDRLFIGSNPVSTATMQSITFPLPEDASFIDMFGDGRYLLSEDGRMLSYTQPVSPGQAMSLHYMLQLPYSGSLNMDQQIPYRMDGIVEILVDAPGLEITSEQLPFLGTQTVDGQSFDGYGATLNLNAGQTLRFGIEGQVDANAANSPVTSETSSTSTSNNDSVLSTVLIVAGVFLVALAGVLYFRDRFVQGVSNAISANVSPKEQVNQLIKRIAELDRQHADGGIDSALYEQERATLKTQVALLMKQSTQGV